MSKCGGDVAQHQKARVTREQTDVIFQNCSPVPGSAPRLAASWQQPIRADERKLAEVALPSWHLARRARSPFAAATWAVCTALGSDGHGHTCPSAPGHCQEVRITWWGWSWEGTGSPALQDGTCDTQGVFPRRKRGLTGVRQSELGCFQVGVVTRRWCVIQAALFLSCAFDYLKLYDYV